MAPCDVRSWEYKTGNISIGYLKHRHVNCWLNVMPGLRWQSCAFVSCDSIEHTISDCLSRITNFQDSLSGDTKKDVSLLAYELKDMCDNTCQSLCRKFNHFLYPLCEQGGEIRSEANLCFSTFCDETHKIQSIIPQIAKFMGPTWGPPGSCRPQMGPMLAP